MIDKSESAFTALVVPEGAFHFPITTDFETRNLGFLLLPEFTLLAFSAAVDPLRIANQLAQKPLYQWAVLSQDGRPVTSSSGIEVSVQGTLNVLTANQRVLVCSGNRGLTVATDDTLAKLRKHRRFGGTVGGICTGASTLARA